MLSCCSFTANITYLYQSAHNCSFLAVVHFVWEQILMHWNCTKMRLRASLLKFFSRMIPLPPFHKGREVEGKKQRRVGWRGVGMEGGGGIRGEDGREE